MQTNIVKCKRTAIQVRKETIQAKDSNSLKLEVISRPQTSKLSRDRREKKINVLGYMEDKRNYFCSEEITQIPCGTGQYGVTFSMHVQKLW